MILFSIFQDIIRIVLSRVPDVLKIKSSCDLFFIQIFLTVHRSILFLRQRLITISRQ
jgi:hypothetical protein